MVGHDWGGGIAWHVAMMHPEVVDCLIVLNAPHPAAFLRELRSILADLSQALTQAEAGNSNNRQAA